MEDERIDAVVLAGGVNRIRLFAGDGEGYKALLEFAGKPSLRYVLEALRAVPEIGRIAVLGPSVRLQEVIAGIPECEIVEGTPSLGGNIFLGLRHFAESSAVLFATADAPLLTAESVGRFLQACAARVQGEAAVFLAFVPQKAFSGAFRGHEKARVFFRDVVACHGNLALADPRLTVHSRLASQVDGIYEVRKHTLRTAFAFGWSIAVSYLVGGWFLRLLTLEKMAEFASRRIGLRLVPVLVDYPEIAVDVDEPKDFAFVSARLEKRAAARESGQAR